MGSGSSIRTRTELFATGMTRRAIESALRAGRLVRLRRGVYADADACESVMGAALLGGAPACVSAARHHGLWTLAAPEPLHVGLSPHGHRRGTGWVPHWDHDTVDTFGVPTIV